MEGPSLRSSFCSPHLSRESVETVMEIEEDEVLRARLTL